MENLLNDNKSILHECVKMKWYSSKIREQEGIFPTPLICFGHSADSDAKILSQQSTLDTLVVDELEELSHICECKTFIEREINFIGIWAMSRTTKIGEALEAIKIFRQKQRGLALALYGGWEYNIERVAKRAIECKADGIIMPGIDVNEMFSYLFGVLDEVTDGSTIPTTIDEHRKRLKQYTSLKSPFWKLQHIRSSPYF